MSLGSRSVVENAAFVVSPFYIHSADKREVEDLRHRGYWLGESRR